MAPFTAVGPYHVTTGRRIGIAGLTVVLASSAAFGQAALRGSAAPPTAVTPQPFFVLPDTSDKPSAPSNVARLPSIQSSLGADGDPGGIRAFLGERGLTYTLLAIAEVLGNTTGGVKRGATFESRIEGRFDLDLGRFTNLNGAALHTSLYQINGRGLSGNNTLDLFTVSGIEAFPSTRLYEAWFEQALEADPTTRAKVFVRLGQLAADREFFTSRTATLFFNATFGWPASLANDLPSGGPAFPLATPGLRLKIVPDDHLALLAAVLDGDPAGPFRPGVDSPLPQVRDLSGTSLRLRDAPLLIGEAAYTYNEEGDLATLPGTVKLGAFQHLGTFASAGQIASGAARPYRGDNGVYGVIDQTVYRPPDVGQDRQGAALFLRASASPSDRNLVDLYFDGGLAYKGLFPGRPTDTTGVAAAYARISPDASAADIAAKTLLVRDYQATVEATHQFTIAPGLSVQLDVQYIVHPGAHGVGDPSTGLPIHNATVFGLRTAVRY